MYGLTKFWTYSPIAVKPKQLLLSSQRGSSPRTNAVSFIIHGSEFRSFQRILYYFCDSAQNLILKNMFYSSLITVSIEYWMRYLQKYPFSVNCICFTVSLSITTCFSDFLLFLTSMDAFVYKTNMILIESSNIAFYTSIYFF